MSAQAITGVILAGGSSRRMGQPKALMPWGSGTLIDAMIARLRPVVDEVLIVAKDATPFVGKGARVVADLLPESHPWVGLYTGLVSAAHEISFVCACDMPWLVPAVIGYLRKVLDGSDAVIPEGASGLEPLHALYTRRCAAVLARCWDRGVRTLKEMVGELCVRIVTAQELQGIEGWERSFTNLNTPEEVSRSAALNG